jgi:hypothetical protein
MDRAANTALAKVHCVQKYENIRDTLLDLDKRYGFVIVDAAGRDSRCSMRSTISRVSADVLLFTPVPLFFVNGLFCCDRLLRKKLNIGYSSKTVFNKPWFALIRLKAMSCWLISWSMAR